MKKMWWGKLNIEFHGPKINTVKNAVVAPAAAAIFFEKGDMTLLREEGKILRKS